MKANVGPIDKTIRIIVALAVFGVGYYFKSWWGLVGVVPLLTAFVGFCPLYRVLGLNTGARKDP